MKKFKKLFILAIAILAVFTLTACDSEVGTDSEAIRINLTDSSEELIEGNVRLEQNGVEIASRDNTSSITFFVEPGEYDVIAEALGQSYTKTITIPEVKEITFDKFSEADDGNNEEEETAEAELVAHYALDGDLTDSTGNFGDATVVGPNLEESTGSENVSYTNGAVNQAIKFDESYAVELPDGLINGSEYSISLFFSANVLNNFTSALFAENSDYWLNLMPGGHGANANLFIWANDKVAGEFNDVGVSSEAFNADTVYHVVLGVSNGNADVYVNGNLINEGNPIYDMFTINGTTFALGGNPFPDAAFNGLIDDLRIYDRAISAEKVTEIYNMAQ